MSISFLKHADVTFPWEDVIRTISFSITDANAVDVLACLVESKGVAIHAINGFSSDEICCLYHHNIRCEGVQEKH